MVSDLVIESIKLSIGQTIIFYTDLGYRYEGIVLGCDGEFLKYQDRKTGVRLIKISQIREAELK